MFYSADWDLREALFTLCNKIYYTVYANLCYNVACTACSTSQQIFCAHCLQQLLTVIHPSGLACMCHLSSVRGLYPVVAATPIMLITCAAIARCLLTLYCVAVFACIVFTIVCCYASIIAHNIKLCATLHIVTLALKSVQNLCASSRKANKHSLRYAVAFMQTLCSVAY